jgi:tetratricopeptide (TPR) repeat protein
MRRDKTRHAFTRPIFLYVLIFLAAAICITSLAGCAKEKKPVHKKIPPRERREPPESIRPYELPEERAMTPERQASNRLVEQGKVFLNNDELERAISTFSDAINVDTGNGEAYYYLAITHAKQGEPDVAVGLLDKADALLSRDPEWSERIDQARRDLGMGPTKEVTPSPIDQAF